MGQQYLVYFSFNQIGNFVSCLHVLDEIDMHYFYINDEAYPEEGVETIKNHNLYLAPSNNDALNPPYYSVTELFQVIGSSTNSYSKCFTKCWLNYAPYSLII